MAPTLNGLGAVKPHVRAAAEEISGRFGITNIGGKATTGHISGSDHYTGHAIDVMTLTDSAKGQKVAEWTIANAARLGVKYVIWNRRIWQNGKWTAYFGTSPHTDHVHISFNTTGGDPNATVTDNDGNSLGDRSGCVALLKTVLGG